MSTLFPTQNPSGQPNSTQAIFEMAQAQELQSRTIRSNAEVHEFFRSRLDADIKKHQQDLEVFNKRLTELNVREQEVNAKSKKADEALLAAMQAEESAKKLQADNATKEQELKPWIDQAAQIKSQRDEAIKTAAQAEIDKKAAEEARASANSMLAQLQEIESKMQAFQPALFPACLATENYRTWQKNLLDQSQNSAASFVLAALATFCVADRSNDADELANALRELGRRLYAFSPDVQSVNGIADALTKASNGRFQLKCPQIGEPTNPNSMNFRPGLATVQKIQNWGVLKNENGQFSVAVKAEVA